MKNYDLKLPIIKGPAPEPEPLSMEEYLKFVEFILREIPVDWKAETQDKKLQAVNVPFKIEGD